MKETFSWSFTALFLIKTRIWLFKTENYILNIFVAKHAKTLPYFFSFFFPSKNMVEPFKVLNILIFFSPKTVIMFDFLCSTRLFRSLGS